jgi:hypothetical protein
MTQALSREQKIERSEQLTKESYYKASIVDKIVDIRDYRHGDEDFIRIFRRVYVPDEWFTQTDKMEIMSDLVFEEFGSDIALSEKKYFIEEKILKDEQIRRNKVDEINLKSLEKTADLLLNDGFLPTVIFAPVEYYVQFYADWLGSNLQIGKDPHTIKMSGRSYSIFWTNKYAPFKEFIFIDKSFGEWISKPSFNERFYVKISPSDKPDQLDFLAYTTAKLSIKEPRKIAILELSEPPPR